MAADSKRAPDTAQSSDTKRDLSLLTNPDGSLLDMVTPEIAAEFLRMSLRQIRNRINKGTLAGEGSRHERRILVGSLLAYEPYTPERRSANTKKSWANRTAEERSRIAKAREAKLTPEQRSARSAKVRAQWTKYTPEQRSKHRASVKAQWAKYTREQRSERAKKANEARSAKHGPEAQSRISKKAWAEYTPKERRARAENTAAARWGAPDQHIAMAKTMATRMANLTPEQRRAISQKARGAITPEQKSAIAKKAAAGRMTKLTAEQRSEITKKANAARSPEPAVP